MPGDEATGRILLVDDDVDLRDSLADALEAEGFSVMRAGNGEQALAHLRERGSAAPDVILLDLLMPVMNGWQFCQEKQRDPALARIPVVAMSAAVSNDPASPYFIEVDDSIAKPVEWDDLIAKVRQYTGPPRRSA